MSEIEREALAAMQQALVNVQAERDSLRGVTKDLGRHYDDLLEIAVRYRQALELIASLDTIGSGEARKALGIGLVESVGVDPIAPGSTPPLTEKPQSTATAIAPQRSEP